MIISLIVTPSSLRSHHQGILLLQLGGGGREAPAAAAQCQQDPHRGLGESLIFVSIYFSPQPQFSQKIFVFLSTAD